MEENEEPYFSCCLRCGKKRAFLSGSLLGIALTLILLFSTGFLRYSQDISNFSAVNQGIQSSPVSLRRRYPDAIIIGVKKGGTRALLDMLNLHPQVTAAKGEVHFFDKEENYERGRKWYLNRMPAPRSRAVKVVEKTPAYFVTSSVPERIIATLPNNRSVRLILIVRDPVTRSISDFTQLHNKRIARISAVNSPRTQTFEEFVLTDDGKVKESAKVLTVSLYDVHYQRWLEYFSKDQILVVNGDALIDGPLEELKRAESFLGVPSYFNDSMFYFNDTKGFYCWRKPRPWKKGTSNAIKSVCLGSAKGRTHPTVSNATIQALREYFRPHMKDFCNLSGLDCAWCDYRLHM